MTKICYVCEEELPATVEFFHQDSRRPDGFTSTCKSCKKKGSTCSYPARSCEECNETFSPKQKTQRFCTQDCAQKAYFSRLTSHVTRLAPGTRGAVSELRAAIDLTERGYEVFRAVSPHASCDLIALASDKSLRIEVRTGTKNLITGTVSFPKNGHDKSGRTEADLDHYAIVISDEVSYQPDLPGLV